MGELIDRSIGRTGTRRVLRRPAPATAIRREAPVAENHAANGEARLTLAEMLPVTSWQPERRNRLFLVAGLGLLLVLILNRAHNALFPYLLALLLAYLMLPAVNWLDVRLRAMLGGRAGLARPLAIVCVYLLTIGLIAAFISMVVPVLSQQFNALWAAHDQLIAQGTELAQRSIKWYQENVPPSVQTQVLDSSRRIGDSIMSAVQVGVTSTFTLVTGTVSFVLGILVIPFWLFYVLNDETKALHALMELVPPRQRSDVHNLLHIVDNVLGAYVRGQLLLSLCIGVLATIGLTILKVPFPAVLGLIAALCELIPLIGPTLGAIPAVLVAVIQSPLLGLWTFLMWVGIQQIENYVLAPRIAGNAVRLHPALIMLVLVLGNEVAGLWGMLIAVPLTAIVRDVFRYLYMRFQDDPVAPEKALAGVKRR